MSQHFPPVFVVTKLDIFEVTSSERPLFEAVSTLVSLEPLDNFNMILSEDIFSSCVCGNRAVYFW